MILPMLAMFHKGSIGHLTANVYLFSGENWSIKVFFFFIFRFVSNNYFSNLKSGLFFFYVFNFLFIVVAIVIILLS